MGWTWAKISAVAATAASVYVLTDMVLFLLENNRHFDQKSPPKERQLPPESQITSSRHRVAHIPFGSSLKSSSPPYSPESIALYKLFLRVASDALHSKAMVFHEFSCSFCRTRTIAGVLYRCTECGTVNMCEACEREGLHDPAHILYKINIPIPAQLDNLSCTQLPWVTEHHLEYEKFHDVPVSLSFEQIETMKKAVDSQMSSAEIEALYDQFRCLVDWPYPKSSSSEFHDAGCIAQSSFEQVLATRYMGPSTPLREFLLDLYDKDGDHLVSFPDFVHGTNLIINSTMEVKADYLIGWLCRDRTATVAVYQVKTLVRNLFLSYIDLSQRIFADALSLQTMPSFEEEEDDSSTDYDGNISQELDSLLWEQRHEHDTWANYDPFPGDHAADNEIALLWDMSVESIVSDMFNDMKAEFDHKKFKETILNDPQLMGSIVAFFEAGII
jgi:Ca2+-binding EF-hand superfamily protein